jgi:hypothetical protein
MKNKSFPLILIISIFLTSCVQNQKGKIELKDLSKNNEVNIDSIEKKAEINNKDTLFSILTSDMNYSQFLNAVEELSKENPSFYIEDRKLTTSVFDKPGANQYYKQPCYIFYVNDKEYRFDLDFNEYDIDLDMNWYEEIRKNIDGTLNFLVLHFEENGKSIINDVLSLYKTKYGQFNKNVYSKERFVRVGDYFSTDSEDALASITSTDNYTWKNKRTLLIKYVKIDQIREYWHGRLIPRTKTNTIYIIYFSEKFYPKWQEIEKRMLMQEREMLNKKRTINKKDI